MNKEYIKTNTLDSLKKVLIGGASIVAMSAFPLAAHAADIVGVAGTNGNGSTPIIIDFTITSTHAATDRAELAEDLFVQAAKNDADNIIAIAADGTVSELVKLVFAGETGKTIAGIALNDDVVKNSAPSGFTGNDIVFAGKLSLGFTESITFESATASAGSLFLDNAATSPIGITTTSLDFDIDTGKIVTLDLTKLTDDGTNEKFWINSDRSTKSKYVVKGDGTLKFLSKHDTNPTLIQDPISGGVNTASGLGGAAGKVLAVGKQTYVGAIGASDKGLESVTIGDLAATVASTVDFSAAVTSKNIKVIGGGNTIVADATFDENVEAIEISVTGGNHSGGGATSTFKKNVTAENITLDDGSALAKVVFAGAADSIVIGSIKAATDADGEIKITSDSNTTFKGKIGTEDNKIGKIDISNSTEAKPVVFQKDVYADAFVFTPDTSSVKFESSVPQIIDAPITTATNNQGVLEVLGTGLKTFKQQIGASSTKLKTIKIEANGKVNFDKQVFASALNGSGSVHKNELAFAVKENTIGDVYLDDGSSITVTADLSSVSNATIITGTIKGNGLTATNSKIVVNITTPKIGGVYQLFSVSEAGASADKFDVESNPFSHFVITKANATAAIVATFKGEKSAEAVAESFGVSVGLAPALKLANKVSSGGTYITSISKDAVKKKKFAEQVVIPVAAFKGASSIASSVASQISGAVSSRTSTLRADSGFSSGDVYTSGSNLWIKPFGAISKYTPETDSKKDGYSANFFGAAVGADAEVGDGFILGSSFTYGLGEVTVDNQGGHKNTISSYGISLYSSFSTGSIFAEINGGYNINSYSSTRELETEVKNTYTAEYKGSTIYGSARIGVPIGFETGTSNLSLVPSIGVTGASTSTDGFTEKAVNTSEKGFTQTVESTSATIFDLDGGVKIESRTQLRVGHVTPYASLGIGYEFGSKEDVNYKASFGESVDTFIVSNKDTSEKEDVDSDDDEEENKESTTSFIPDGLAGKIGFGVNYDDGLWNLGVSYNLTIKKSQFDHAGTLKVGFKF